MLKILYALQLLYLGLSPVVRWNRLLRYWVGVNLHLGFLRLIILIYWRKWLKVFLRLSSQNILYLIHLVIFWSYLVVWDFNNLISYPGIFRGVTIIWFCWNWENWLKVPLVKLITIISKYYKTWNYWALKEKHRCDPPFKNFFWILIFLEYSINIVNNSKRA